MKKRKVIVGHTQGLHTRPAVLVVKLASSFSCDVRLVNKKLDVDVDAKSMMGLLMLEASHKTELVLIVDGEDEDKALEELSTLIENDNKSKLEDDNNKERAGLLEKIKSFLSKNG
ncbi:MAG: HPr family phosphocarrier protein [Candidatus Zixiibacteriota bacterium]